MKPKFIPVNCEYKKKLPWHSICQNCDDLSFLYDNSKFISKSKGHTKFLCANYHAVPLLMRNENLIDLRHLSSNTNPIAIDYLDKNLDIFLEKPTEYLYDRLFENTSEKAIKLIEKILLMEDKEKNRLYKRKNIDCAICMSKNLKCIDCYCRDLSSLAGNKSAVHILETLLKEEKLNGVDGLKIPLFMHRDRLVRQHHPLWMGNEQPSRTFWFYIAGNENASPYLINKLQEHVMEEIDIEMNREKPYAASDNWEIDHFDRGFMCSLTSPIREMLENTKNEEMVKAGKYTFEKLIECLTPSQRSTMFLVTINNIVENNHIDLIENFYNKWSKPNVDVNWLSFDLEFEIIPTIHKDADYWWQLCEVPNPKVMEIVEKHISSLLELAENPYFDIIVSSLSKNPEALSILEKYEDQLFDVTEGLANPNTKIYPLIKRNFDKINWQRYPYALRMSQEHTGVNPKVFMEDVPIDRIPKVLAGNGWQWQVEDVVIRRNFKKLYDDGIRHPFLEEHLKANSFEFCRDNIKRFSLDMCQIYPTRYLVALFNKIDYEGMKDENSEFNSELASYVFHPARVERMADLFQIEFSDYLESLE